VIDPARMTTTALWMRLQLCPAEDRLWTEHEKAVRDEYDRRILAIDAERRAA